MFRLVWSHLQAESLRNKLFFLTQSLGFVCVCVCVSCGGEIALFFHFTVVHFTIFGCIGW
jgi:hypothetical protein